MFERLAAKDRIDLAKTKMARVLDHFLYVLELHANNSFVVYASGRVLGWLFRRSQEMADEKDYDLLNAIDLQKRATWAIISPQSELLPYEKRRLPAFQLRFSGF
jgi:hypothetical protein